MSRRPHLNEIYINQVPLFTQVFSLGYFISIPTIPTTTIQSNSRIRYIEYIEYIYIQISNMWTFVPMADFSPKTYVNLLDIHII